MIDSDESTAKAFNFTPDLHITELQNLRLMVNERGRTYWRNRARLKAAAEKAASDAAFIADSITPETIGRAPWTPIGSGHFPDLPLLVTRVLSLREEVSELVVAYRESERDAKPHQPGTDKRCWTCQRMEG